MKELFRISLAFIAILGIVHFTEGSPGKKGRTGDDKKEIVVPRTDVGGIVKTQDDIKLGPIDALGIQIPDKPKRRGRTEIDEPSVEQLPKAPTTKNNPVPAVPDPPSPQIPPQPQLPQPQVPQPQVPPQLPQQLPPP